jgi:protein transport protein SEC61 subunit alpha
MLITVGQGIVYVYSGMYGDFNDLGLGNAFLLVAQLFFAGILVIVWDELLQKGIIFVFNFCFCFSSFFGDY